MARLAVHPNVAATLFHNAVNGREAEPVPFPCSFVVKKGSKIWDWVSLSIPQPVSLTTSCT